MSRTSARDSARSWSAGLSFTAASSAAPVTAVAGVNVGAERSAHQGAGLGPHLGAERAPWDRYGFGRLLQEAAIETNPLGLCRLADYVSNACDMADRKILRPLVSTGYARRWRVTAGRLR